MERIRKTISKSKELKYCCDCKYFQLNDNTNQDMEFRIEYSKCTHTNIGSKHLLCHDMEPNYHYCSTSRSNEHLCGKGAKWYGAK